MLTPPTATIADISGNTPHNTNTALYIGIIVSLVALLFIVAMTAMVTVACVSVKKKKTQPGVVSIALQQHNVMSPGLLQTWLYTKQLLRKMGLLSMQPSLSP